MNQIHQRNVQQFRARTQHVHRLQNQMQRSRDLQHQRNRNAAGGYYLSTQGRANRGGSGLGTAAVGAGIGGFIGGPVGVAIGAAAGWLIGKLR